jgi:arginase
MAIRIITVPYDSGHRAERMGRGPAHLIDHGDLPHKLRRLDPDVRLVPVETAAGFATEIGTAFELHRAVSGDVVAAARAGALPLVLSGNCNSAVGTVAGLRAASPDEPVGVVWFDGHGDCNTPETFTGDFLDAMGLSTLTGRCWQALAATVPGFRPVPDEHVVLVGGHGMDDGARGVLNASRVTNVPTADILARGPDEALKPALDALRRRGVSRVYLHLDVDVLDATFAPANEFAPEGGLLPDHLAEAVKAVAGRFTIAAAAVASYDPAHDRDDRVLQAALRVLGLVAVRHRQGSSGENSPARP